MSEIKVLPIEWPITIVRGDKQGPITGTVKDINGQTITDYTWQLVVKKGREQVYAYSGSDTSGEFVLDLTNTFAAGQYTHYLQITKGGWTFTVIAGPFWNSTPGEVTGGQVGFGDFTITLPLVFDPVSGQVEFSSDFSAIDFKIN